MTKKTSDFFVERLKAWGVTRIYGYPGDGINGVLGALQRADKAGDGIEFIQVRHEEMAAFMACGHAKFTGEPGVCLSTGGPGATHLLTGLYDAQMDHMPVIAIAGQAETTARGATYQQELNLDRVFSDVASFVQEAATPAQLRHLVDRGVRIAKANNGVTVLILPKDLQDEPWQEPQHAHGFTHSGPGYQRPHVIPHQYDLQRAADILNDGKKVAILIGAGAREAAVEVVQAANLLGAGVAKALLGKDVLPDDAPFVTGCIGLLGTEPSWDLMHGDAVSTLQALLPLLKRKEDRSWQEKIAVSIKAWWEKIEERAMAKATPVNPQRVVWEMSPLLPDNAIVTSDSGSCANWFARDYRVKQGQRASLSGGLACMGAAVPYAIAAKFAFPEKPVVALVGDGAMQMNNLAELITIQKYWQRWSDPRLIVCVFNNQDLNQVTWEQRIMEGNPRFTATQDVPDVPYAQFAESIGLKGIYVDSPEELQAAWQQALAADRPVVLEVKTDPEVAPLPPHISFAQAKGFISSMAKGDKSAGKVIADTAHQVMNTVLPGKK
ncbi:pyruvate oxidase [Cronobacter sakazakii]|uniref:pyruvate oxidase n=1 Tax=Cronobacter sakazakii TaxID=28141 RepID=UPI001C0ACC21|nr:pyruvate oxidase [Cronobacter sakazakii]QWR90585.1 pyruvate oxidase [Cronobacter sakazakii]